MIEKIIMDTDIGSDIDDVFCLAYLLAHPSCKLLGVTTVSGESEQRGRIASAICRAFEKDLPIVPGVEEPLLVEQRQRKAQQAVRLENWDHQTDFPRINAIEFLAEKILENPGEITLLTIGPLTNIALLFAVYPETAPALKQLVMMCGAFSKTADLRNKLEWNVLLDPHAAYKVFQTPVRIHKSIGLDVTLRVKLSATEVRSRFIHPRLCPVLDFASVWFRNHDVLVFHDPLAAATIFEPDLCRFEQGRVTVNCDPTDGLFGSTTFIQGESENPHQVAVDVNPDQFFKTFSAVFNG